ncbi:302_t:CDS:10 [Entrophospora sp. SA101]|nr:302_t:CDS:10 [Entrophospora sp. SA101]
MDNCPKCNIKNKYPYCCHLCLPSYFQDEFSNWSCGNQTIDKCIQDIQLDATEWCQYLEWIPYERLVNVHYLAKGGYGKVYSAIWLDGPKTFDRDKIEIFSRKENHPVALKSINQLGLNMEEWFSEASKSFGNKMLWKTKLYLLVRMSIALFTIHRASLVHRDLHNGNIMLDDDDEDSSTILVPMIRVDDFEESDILGFCDRIKSKNSNKLISKLHDKAVYTSRLMDFGNLDSIKGTDRDVRFTLNDGLERSKIDEAKNNPLAIPARILVMHAAEERQKLGFALYSFFEGSDLIAEICHQAEALGNTQDFVDFFYLRITKHVFTRNGTFEISADYFVKSLPGLPDNQDLLKTHAGHIKINKETNTNIFFWLFHNKHIADKSRLIIWLNGGPGCSSMDGVFLENGPWRMNSDQTLNSTSSSWNEYANVLYVDQPAGTGFSFADSNNYLTNITQVYLTGESYAGTFIPYIAKAIIDRIAIGNGWIDPVSQYNAYYTFAVEKNLLDSEHKTLAEKQLETCKGMLNKQVQIHLDSCEDILSTVLESSRRRSGNDDNCINQYDIRDYTDTFPSCGINWPYELTTIRSYLRRTDVVGAIHADSQQLGWVECNGGVGRLFNDDVSPPSLLPDLLKNINVLLYNGDQDFVCNVNGIRDMISNLEWNGSKGFMNNTAKPWYINDEIVGEVTSERNLTYAVIYKASHMVPYDAPVQNNPTEDNTKDWDKYYNAGTATLIIVIIGVVGLVIWVFRGKLIRRRRTTTSQAMKAAVEAENNEIDEENEEGKQSRQSSDQLQQNIRERSQNTRYRDIDSENNSEERVRLRDSEDH